MSSRATTYAQLLASKAPGCQVLAQVGAFELLQDGDWTAAGGGYTNVWKTTITQRLQIHNFRTIGSVTFGDQALDPPEAVALTQQASIQDVEDNLGSSFFDPDTSILYVSLDSAADPNDQVAYAGFTLYFSTGDPYTPGRCFIEELAGTVYYPYICEAPSTEKALEDPFLGSITTGTATIGLDAATGNLDAIWRLYVWQYGTVVVLFGGADLPIPEYATLFVGSTIGKSWSDGVARLSLVDGCDPLLANIYGALFVTADITNSIAYTGSGSYGYGYQGASSNVASTAVTATGNINSTGAMVQVIEVGQPKPIAYGSLKGFQPPIVSMNSTGATAQTAIVCLTDLAYKTITQVYVGGLTTRVSWWINPASGFLAVMLTLGGGAAPSISSGITVDFEASGASETVTMTIATPCVVTWTSHGLTTNRPLVFATTGALPTGLTAGTTYYVKYLTADTFNVAATAGGASINTSGSQSGTHSAKAVMTNPADIFQALCTNVRSSAAEVSPIVAPPDFGFTNHAAVSTDIQVDFVAPAPATGPVITSADESTPVTFYNPSGSFAVPIGTANPYFDSCQTDLWPTGAQFTASPAGWVISQIPTGQNRPSTVGGGTYTAFAPQIWLKMRTVEPALLTQYKYAFKADGTSAFSTFQHRFTAVLICLGASYTSVSAIRVGGSATNVGWYEARADGLLWVFKIQATANTEPPDFGIPTGAASTATDIEVDFISDGPALTAADKSTPVTFSGPSGSFRVPINTAYASFASCVDTTWPPTSAWTSKTFDDGSFNRPGNRGSVTAFYPQQWCKMRTVVTVSPPYNFAFNADGTYVFDLSKHKFTAVLICLGASYTSISAIRVGGSTTNVGWYGNAAAGLVWIFKIAEAQPPPIASPVATGQVLSLDTDVLAASRVLCTDYSIALSVSSATPLRDILMRIARDTLSYVYVSNAGLIRFETYEPNTDDEEELTEDTGDFLVSPDVEEPADRCYRAVQVEYSFDTNRANRNGGNYLTTSYTVAESVGLLTGRVTDFTVFASYHAIESSALILAERLAKLLSRGAPTYRVTAPIKCMSWDLADKVSVDRARLPVAVPGTDVAHCYVTRITRDLANVQITLELTENLIADLLGGW